MQEAVLIRIPDKLQTKNRVQKTGGSPPPNLINNRFDICVMLWLKLEQKADGSIWWHDINTKYIYFKKKILPLM